MCFFPFTTFILKLIAENDLGACMNSTDKKYLYCVTLFWLFHSTLDKKYCHDYDVHEKPGEMKIPSCMRKVNQFIKQEPLKILVR